MKRKPFLKRSVPIWATLVIVILLSGSIAALMIYSIGVENISIWGGEIQDSKFAVVSLSTKIKGKNGVNIFLTIRNTDIVIHSANVSIQLLYENGDVIVEDTRTVENIGGESNTSLNYKFKQKGLTALYDRPLVVIHDI